MTDLALVLALTVLGQGPADGPELVANPLYKTVLDRGFVVEGVTVKLPPPILREGMTEAERRSALKAAVDLPLDEFLRDSVNAPFKIKLRDVPYPTGMVRVVDLWFALHAHIDEIKLDDLAGKKAPDGKETPPEEVGNMSFAGRILNDADLQARSIEPSHNGLDRYAFSRGVLLDRVKVSSVNHVVGAKAGGALLIAFRTDPAFDRDEDLGNRWVSLSMPGDAKKDPGPPRTYAGSAGYARVGQFSESPAVLLIESHLAFAEPKAWFNGASVLRGKLSLIAQDQIRKLRREVAARHKKEGKPAEAAKP